jgi:FemAB-related protein (PEP-CTERM system-associated)
MMSPTAAAHEMPALEHPAPPMQAAVVAVETTPEAWTEYVLSCGTAATGYHDWQWRTVFKKAFGHDSIYFAARRQGRIVGVLPTVLLDSWLFGTALISLPFVNYGGVVADDDLAARALLDAATEAARDRRCRHVELRHVQRRFADLPCKQHKVTMTLALQPAPALWDGLDRKVRNQVRKAQKSGLTYRAGGLELLEEFYAVFARNMRDLGTPVYSPDFFAQILKAFPERSRIHVVSHGATPAAAGLTFQTGSTVEIPWASAVRDLNPLCPNPLLYWSMLEGAAARGCLTFDFGRSTPNEGTYRFKAQWGAEPVPLCWEYSLLGGAELPNTSPTNPKFGLAVALWKKLPLPVANGIGPMIVRAIP